ncbi:MAG: hypothetical protein H8K04_07970 [Nitrospira sp.]
MKRYLGAAATFVLAIAACQTLPTMTRSGDVKDIFIEDAQSTATYVHGDVGDEIRWTNKRTASVRITFLNRISDQLLCRNNFDGYFTGGVDTTLKPDQSASLCFGDRATIPYIVRIYSTSTNTEVSRSGQVHIEAALLHPLANDKSATDRTGP